MLRLIDLKLIEKDIIITVGIYISALEHCRKMKFRTYLHLKLISKIFNVVTVDFDSLWCLVEIFIFVAMGSISKV